MSEQAGLKCADWQFPIGDSTARLVIVPDNGGVITPEDLGELIKLIRIMKRQLEKREAT